MLVLSAAFLFYISIYDLATKNPSAHYDTEGILRVCLNFSVKETLSSYFYIFFRSASPFSLVR